MHQNPSVLPLNLERINRISKISLCQQHTPKHDNVHHRPSNQTHDVVLQSHQNNVQNILQENNKTKRSLKPSAKVQNVYHFFP